MGYIDHVKKLANDIADAVIRKDAEYGGSWLKRGGVGAYFVMIRKFDRLETQCRKFKFDILEAIQDQEPGEPLVDTIDDAIGYLLLIRSEAIERSGRRAVDAPELGGLKAVVKVDHVCEECGHHRSEHAMGIHSCLRQGCTCKRFA